MEGQWIAHASALPGCYAGAGDRETALALVPDAIREFVAWRRMHGETGGVDDAVDTHVEEIVREWPDPADPEYIVNAFFASDVPALTADDIRWARERLDWQRAELFAAFDGLSPEVMRQPVDGEWSIGGILNHTGRAEWWYLERLDLALPRDQEPKDWRGRLDMAREQLLRVLTSLEGVARVVVKNAEMWSPRKMLRRALWHERDHTLHLLQFRARLGV